MQHRRKGRILQRERDQRTALVRSLMRAIIIEREITTIEARAKAIRPMLEKLITKEKRGTLAAHREVIATIGAEAAKELKTVVLPKIGERTSGFLRITKLGVRKSDASKMVRIGFVD